MLQIELLPAGPGDCLWLEYGEPGNSHIILIDGGVKDTSEYIEKRIGQATKDRGTSELHIELLVITHIDNDHINGIIELLNQTKHRITFGDIWFNGNHQLANLPEPTPEEMRPDLLGELGEVPRPDLLGLKEADKLSKLLSTRRVTWNKAFNSAAVVVPIQGDLESRDFDCGLKLTVLGPPMIRLRKLAKDWKEFKDGKSEERGDLLGRLDTWPPEWQNLPKTDNSVNNGSSIVLLVEYNKKSLLLTGDAYPKDIEAGLTRLLAERKLLGRKLPLTTMKLPHHGSARNISQDLIEKVSCNQYLISTDGSGNSMHPDHQSLLRVLKYSSVRPCLGFNYDTSTTRNWRNKDDVILLVKKAYDTIYSEDPDSGLVLELE